MGVMQFASGEIEGRWRRLTNSTQSWSLVVTLLSNSVWDSAAVSVLRCMPRDGSGLIGQGVRVATQASQENNSNLLVYLAAFFLTTLGIVYVQEAERRIPMNYAQRTRINRLSQQSYLPFKAMPVDALYMLHCFGVSLVTILSIDLSVWVSHEMSPGMTFLLCNFW